MAKFLIPSDDDDLFRQCEFMTFRSSGKGGQHVNKTESAVRLKHEPTQIVVTSQAFRSQWRNRLDCLNKLRERIEELNVEVKPRKATKVPKSIKQEIRVDKLKHSKKKQSRTSKDWNRE